MVNFNFGLGGLGGSDDDKKDDATATTMGDDATQDDAVVADDNSVVTDENPAEKVAESDTEEKITANEPVFEAEVTTTESDDLPFVDEAKPDELIAPKIVYENIAESTESADEPALKTMNQEESWLEDDKKPENTENFAETEEVPEITAIEAEVVAETPAESMADLSAPVVTEPAVDEVVAEKTAEIPSEVSTETVVEENPFPEAATPIIEAESPKEEIVETTPQETNLFEESTENPASPELVERTKEIATEPIVNKPLIPAMPKHESTETSNEIPEIPTFGTPEKTETTLETPTEEIAENPSEEIDLPEFPASPEFIAPAKNPTDDLFATTGTDTTEEVAALDDFAEIDPLAPAATAIIGGSLIADDDDDDDDDATQDVLKESVTEVAEIVEKSANNPVETLTELKNGITQFVENHNSKIADYKSQISELNKKIREEKHILKNEQRKSQKILTDLNELVASFSTTTSIKKKIKKKMNKKKTA